MQNKTFSIIGIIIVLAVLIGGGYLIWKHFESIEGLESGIIDEGITKLEPIENNNLIMDEIRKNSDTSSELLSDSCASSIVQEDENFILVNIRWTCTETGGGARALLKKEGGQYNFITMLYEEPSCALMDEYSVPKPFYEACYDSQGELR